MNFDENDVEPITTPDTKNSTKINPKEADGDTDYWRTLRGINRETSDSFGHRIESTTREQERASAFDVLGKELHLISVHRREGRQIMKQVDLEQFTGPQIGIHLIAFCVAANLVNRDSIPRTYHPSRSPENNDEHFIEVAEEMDFDEGLINSNMQKLSNLCGR